MARTKKDVDAWLKALEAERHDQSYKTPPTAFGPLVFNKIVYKERKNKFRDELFWNAGRFAAGARDEAAVSAQKLASKMMKGAEL